MMDYSPGLYFLKIPCIYEAALETVQRHCSNVILESNVTPNITRSSDSFSTVLKIDNGGVRVHCAWLVDFHSLGLTRIQFHSPLVAPLTNHSGVADQRLCYCNLNAWDACTQPSKWSHQLFFRMEKSFKVYRRNNDGSKTLPCGTSGSTLPSLLR